MLKQEQLKDVSSQTLDISLEDEVDALRINTFLPRGVNRREKDTSNEKESPSTEDVHDKSLNRKQATSKILLEALLHNYALTLDRGNQMVDQR